MKKAFLILVLCISGSLAFGQTESLEMKYDTTRLDTNFNISVWGTEPPWSIEFKGLQAMIQLSDTMIACNLHDRRWTNGFTNESVDTYVFSDSNGELYTLILVKDPECHCGYDMGELEPDTKAYLIADYKKIAWTWLGCARISDRPL